MTISFPPSILAGFFRPEFHSADFTGMMMIGETILLVPADPDRVMITFPSNETTNLYVAPFALQDISNGLLLTGGAAGVTITHADWGSLVGHAWYVRDVSGGVTTAYAWTQSYRPPMRRER